jgi:hypothetical protein
MTKHRHIDIDELRRLWEADWSAKDLATRFACTESLIYHLRQKYKFRDRAHLQSTEPPPPSAEDAVASHDSLALSPWVAARAEEFRRQKEERGESLRGGVYLRTYSLRTLQAID